MKSVQLNLVTKTTLLKEVMLPLIFVLLLTSLGMTGFNLVSWLNNNNDIRLYEDRLENLKKRRGKPLKIEKNTNLKKEKIEAVQKDMNFLKTIIAGDMFPVSGILEVIEKSRPDNVEIEEINFSQDFTAVILKGSCESPKDVSSFIITLDRSESFNVQITRGEINKVKEIVFEIFAERGKK